MALKAEILALLASGAPLNEAHHVLRSAGKLTLGYTAFTIHVKALREQAASEPKPAPIPTEVPPQVLAWLSTVPRQPGLPLPAGPSTRTIEQAAAVDHATGQPPLLPGDPSAARPGAKRRPIGAGVEPEVRKFQPFKSGEKNHWDADQAESNQGDDSK